jgi:radical SAM protein with 4Fe4S-binding SPASM domain
MGDPAGRAELCIGGDGTIYPSVLMSGVSELECGDVRDHALAAVWQDAGPLTRLRQVGLSELSACGDCAVRELCGGGSRARAYVETGDVGAQDSLCPLVVAAGHA